MRRFSVAFVGPGFFQYSIPLDFVLFDMMIVGMFEMISISFFPVRFNSDNFLSRSFNWIEIHSPAHILWLIKFECRFKTKITHRYQKNKKDYTFIWLDWFIKTSNWNVFEINHHSSRVACVTTKISWYTGLVKCWMIIIIRVRMTARCM